MTEQLSFLQTDEALVLVEAAREGKDEAIHELVSHAMDFVFPSIMAMIRQQAARGSYVSETMISTENVDAIKDDAWALTHDTCVAMLQQLHTFKGRGFLGRSARFSTWLYGIALNTVRATMRKRQREQRRRWADAGAEDANSPREPLLHRLKDQTTPEPGANLIREARQNTMREALHQAPLTPEQREAVMMFHVHGYSQARIAEHQGVAVGTVKKRIFDGIRKLRDFMEHEERAVSGR